MTTISTEVKKANHQANIIRVMQVLPHPKPDTTNLEIIPIGGYQVVVRKGDFKPGDLAVYIQPDSVVPQTMPFKFIWDKDSSVTFDPNYGNTYTDVPAKKRRITVRRFRGEWSEGLLMPLADFNLQEGQALLPYPDAAGDLLQEGDDISDLLGITHYVSDDEESTHNMHAPRKKRSHPRTLKGWFFFLIHKLGIRTFNSRLHGEDVQNDSLGIPAYDVDALKNYPKTFNEGEEVIATEKIHGANARYVFLDGVMYAGSKNFWKAPDSGDIWRRVLKTVPAIQAFCEAHPGYVLYGEVTPTQKSKGHTYDYGTSDPQFFLFDIRTPDGRWLAYYEVQLMLESDPNGPFITQVPLIYHGPYKQQLIRDLAEGISMVPNYNYIREGVVVKTAINRHVRGLGRAQLKIVNNKFLEKDK